MRSQILMPFLIAGIFGDEVEVFATNDERAVHFGGDDSASQDTTSDRDFTRKRAFFVCVRD